MLGWGSHDLDFIYLYHSCKWSHQCYIQFIDLLYIREHRTGLSWWKTLVMPSFILYLQNCIFSKCSKSMTCWKCIQCRHWSVNQDCRKSFSLLFYFFFIYLFILYEGISVAILFSFFNSRARTMQNFIFSESWVVHNLFTTEKGLEIGWKILWTADDGLTSGE